MKRTTIQNISAVRNIEDVKKVLINIIQVLNTSRATENTNATAASTALNTAESLVGDIDAVEVDLANHLNTASDDHTQYLRVDGTRSSTGTQQFLAGLKAELTSDVVANTIKASLLQSNNLSEWYTSFLSLVTWVDSQAVLNSSNVPSLQSHVANKKYVDDQITTHDHDTDYIRLDGTTTPTANISLGSNRITNLANPVGLQDAVTAAWTLSSFLLLAQNLNDLPNKATARTNLGLGNSATLNVGTTAGTVAAGDHSHNCIFPVWAEESSNPSTATSSGYQWSFGNGATGTGTQLTIGYDCSLTKISLRCNGASPTVTVEVYKNAVATGATVSVVATNKAVSTVTPVTFNAGDTVMFRTTAASGSLGAPNIVTAWFEATI